VGEDDRAAQLRAHRLYLRGRLVADVDDAARHDTFRSGRPRVGIRDERHVPRLGHLDRQLVDLPAAAEVVRLEMRIRETPLREAIACPACRPHVRGRPGETRADVVGECAIERQRAGALQALGPDASERVAGITLLRDDAGDREAEEADEKQDPAHGRRF